MWITCVQRNNIAYAGGRCHPVPPPFRAGATREARDAATGPAGFTPHVGSNSDL